MKVENCSLLQGFDGDFFGGSGFSCSVIPENRESIHKVEKLQRSIFIFSTFRHYLFFMNF